MVSDRDFRSKPRPHRKERKPPQAPSHSSSVSVNALKSKIRDVTRVLKHAQDLPLDVRIEKERALAGYTQDLEKAKNEKERQRMIKKYHMVRFFERQKATRNLKKLRTQLACATPDNPEYQTLKIAVHDAEIDLNYSLFHPLSEKYVGLFPCRGIQKSQDEQDASAKDSREPQRHKPAMWTTVESCMANGTLQALRDGKLKSGSTGPSQQLQPDPTKAGSRNAKEKQYKSQEHGDAASLAANEHENSSDGGFFDE